MRDKNSQENLSLVFLYKFKRHFLRIMKLFFIQHLTKDRKRRVSTWGSLFYQQGTVLNEVPKAKAGDGEASSNFSLVCYVHLRKKCLLKRQESACSPAYMLNNKVYWALSFAVGLVKNLVLNSKLWRKLSQTTLVRSKNLRIYRQ